MTDEDFQQIEEWLYRDCVEAIETFAKTDDNRDVYVFELFFDISNGGSFCLGLNTLKGLEQIKEEYSLTTQEQVEEHGFWSYKWCSGNFPYHDFHSVSEELHDLGWKCAQFFHQLRDEQLSEELRERYVQMVARVMQKLMPHFSVWNRTEDFVAYMYLEHSDDVEIAERMQVTVPPELFDRLFAHFLEVE